MIANRQSLHTSRHLIGMKPIKVGDAARLYSKAIYTASPENSVPIRYGPAVNDCNAELWPGASIELKISTSEMWCYALDVDQLLTLVQA